MPRDRRPRPRVRPGHRDIDRAALPAAPDIDIDQAVADLNHIYIVRGLETMIAIGRYVLDTFFDGDEEAFRSKRQGYTSFKKLYGRTDLAMSYGVLGIAVNVMLQVEQLPRELAYALNTTRHRALLPVKDMELKIELAEAAVEENLAAAKIQRRVQAALGVDSPRLGKKPLSPPAAALRKLDKYSREFVAEQKAGESWEQLSAAEREKLEGKLGLVVRRLQRALGKVEPGEEG